MGANIGTTTTAILAAALSNSSAALAIAFSHLLFNLGAVLLLFPVPKVREIPVQLAQKLGSLTLKNRMIGIAYVLVVFFLIPLNLLIATGNIDFRKSEEEEDPTRNIPVQEEGPEPGAVKEMPEPEIHLEDWL